MPLFIPNKQSKRYSLNLSTDLFGNLARVRGLDFNKPGSLALARKPVAIMTEAEDADFETPLAILGDDDDFYVVTSENVFQISPEQADITVSDLNDDGGTPPSGGFQSDGVFFDSELHVSDSNGVHHYTAGAFAQSFSGLSSSFPHPLCVSEHQQYLAVGNGNTVQLRDTSYTLITTLTIPSDHVVTWIRWRANLLWVGTRNIQGGEAKVFLWNGSGTAAQAGYGVGSEWAFSGCTYEALNTIVVVSASGQLLRFNGSGFVPLRDDAGNEMAFPVYHLGFTWGSSAATSNLLGKVASRGMEARGSRIYMAVDNSMIRPNGGVPTFQPNFPGGLWIFDPKVGLYPKAGMDHKQFTRVAVNSLASDALTLASAQIFETGDPVEVTKSTGLTGDIESDQIYYAIKTSSTVLKLANTPQQAIAGENITITGTVTSVELAFHNYESVGAQISSRTGGLAVIKGQNASRFLFSEVLYGADMTLPAGGTVGAVMSLGMGKNVGSFVTPKLQASAITDTFDQLVSKFKDLNIASRKIIFKYRTKHRWGMPGRRDFDNGKATWVTSTTFTVNPKAYDVYSVEEGDEVEFLEGGASGFTAHITDITVDNATQWTFTIDEAMPDVTASDTSEILIDNWTKYMVISTTEDAAAAAAGFKKTALGGEEEDTANSAKWVEVKVELRGYTDFDDQMEFEELMLNNTADQNY